MLEGFKAIVGSSTLLFNALCMRDIEMNLRKGKPLTKDDERFLKLSLWGMEGLGKSFRDDTHRIKLIEQWWRDAKHHYKSLKEQENKS